MSHLMRIEEVVSRVVENHTFPRGAFRRYGLLADKEGCLLRWNDIYTIRLLRKPFSSF